MFFNDWLGNKTQGESWLSEGKFFQLINIFFSD